MATDNTTHTNDLHVTSGKTYADFVEGHKTTLNWLLQFGSPIERAKAAVLIDLAEGVL